MEEKFYVNIKDDFGVVRTFEVPTLEMKLAIDNIDNELKEQDKERRQHLQEPLLMVRLTSDFNQEVKLNGY